MKKLIVISDWVNDTLTCQEIRSTTEGYIKSRELPKISFISSYPSTIHTSFLINQIVEIEQRFGKPQETVIFENTDPRIQSKNAVKKAKGADFIVILIKSGIYLCGPNAGYNFSMIKSKIANVYIRRDFDKGSQFRSRDLYSKASAQLLEGRIDEIGLEEVDENIIPDLKGWFVGHIDNYGNIKTTIPLSFLKKKFHHGDIIEIEINKVPQKAKFVNNLFGAKPGELVIYPGSSGTIKDPFLEVSIWRHFTEEEATTGIHTFNNPIPGEEIKIKGLS